VVAIPWNKDLTRGGLATSIHQKDPNIQRQLQDSEWLDEATGSGVIVCESNILASRYVFFIHLLKYTQPNVQQVCITSRGRRSELEKFSSSCCV
jgi:hypothetical protein